MPRQGQRRNSRFAGFVKIPSRPFKVPNPILDPHESLGKENTLRVNLNRAWVLLGRLAFASATFVGVALLVVWARRAGYY